MRTLKRGVAELFGGDEGERADVLTPLQQGIDQLKGVLLVGLRTKEVLETEVGVGVDVAATHIAAKIHTILQSSKQFYEKIALVSQFVTFSVMTGRF